MSAAPAPAVPAPVPLCLVTGAAGADKTAFVRALVAARPASEHWAVLDNDPGANPCASADAHTTTATVSGCLCCTGQVALRTALVQLIRRVRPRRLILVASAAAEPQALLGTFRDEHLARAVILRQHWCVAAPQPLLMALQSANGELQLRQLQAADHVVGNDAAALRAVLVRHGMPPERVLGTATAVSRMLAGHG